MSALPVETLAMQMAQTTVAPVAFATQPAAAQSNGRVEQLAWRHARLRVAYPAALPGGSAERAVEVPASQRWGFTELEGRLVEISGAERVAGLTLAAKLTAEAQAVGDIVAWVCGPEGSFYPPDLVAHGIDLSQLAVIRASSPERVALAAIRLLHSGGFGLVVLDLAGPDSALLTVPSPKPRPGRPNLPKGGVSDAHLGRLVQQAQKHQAAVVCLTRTPAQRDSLGSLISVRAEGAVRKVAPDRFLCTAHVLKDKRHGAGWQHEEVLSGPPGLH